VTSFAHSSVVWYRWYRPDRILHSLWHQIKTLLWIAPLFYREQHPDLVHLNAAALLGWGVAAKLMKIPVVCHVRVPLADGYFGVRKTLVKYLTHWFTTAFIPICQYDGSKLIPSDKVHVVYNFVDFQQFDRALDGNKVRRELGVNPEKKIVIYLGGLNPTKGILELLLGAEFFLNKGVSIIIAGRMERNISRLKIVLINLLEYFHIIEAYSTAVKKQIRKLRDQFSENSVIIVGIRNDIPNLLAASDILVFPAAVPHFARPVIEAAAMGKVSVASDLGGLSELIDHEHTGLLVRNGDPKLFGEAVRRLLENPEECKRMGENAYQKAKYLFDSEKNCKMVHDIYESILNSSPPRIKL
jgi:glycosyltransferase involved in cell wall biosynthesis